MHEPVRFYALGMIGFPRRRPASDSSPAAPVQDGSGQPTQVLAWASPWDRADRVDQTSTQALASPAAAPVSDPFASTQVLRREPAAPPPAPPRALVSRRVAAETGMYTGAFLALLAVAAVGVRGWPQWSPAARGASVGMLSVSLVAAGLFVRLPWPRTLSAQRRRGVSTLLTSGAAVAVVAATAAWGSAAAGTVGAGAVAVGAVAVIGAILVSWVARTPLSESALLLALALATWVLVPAGPAVWATLVGLGVAWALAGVRLARGQRTAAVAGVSLALAASVGLAGGAWAWPARALLAAAAIWGLLAFLRGRANGWLALGAGAGAALAGAVAGDVLGPALALLVGGLATMAVSWIALRGASKSEL